MTWRIRTGILALLLILSIASVCTAENGGSEKGEAFMFENEVPQDYRIKRTENGGRVERIHYMSKDYTGDQAEVQKHALIYLPADYSENVPCDILILCHGIGGTESEWKFSDAFSETKNLTDHLFADGYVKNLIIVMPNGRSTAKYSDTSFDNMYSFYTFGQEIRNDLIPYIDANYCTYADREHRAMAGLSMGGMQTINIGMCECLDLISAFGAFSAAPTSYTSSKIASELKQFPENLDIRYFYNICGTEDGTAYPSASAAAKIKPADNRLTENNWHWQELPGGHDMGIWKLGLYNFLKLLGSMQE